MLADDVRACVRCGKQSTRLGVAYRVTVDMLVVDARRARQQAGLEMMLGGSAALAAVLGDRDVVAVAPYGQPAQVCAECLAHVSLLDTMSAMEGVPDVPSE